MYPPAGLSQGEITLADGTARISTPGSVVYAPDFAATQRPFVRVSFGIEHRVTEAAARLRQACAETFAVKGVHMSFDEVLARVLDLLQRQGRVSYRALKRRFDLDDDYLEDLKAEIIKAQRLAVDEGGEVLCGSAPRTRLPHQPTTRSARRYPIPRCISPRRS